MVAKDKRRDENRPNKNWGALTHGEQAAQAMMTL